MDTQYVDMYLRKKKVEAGVADGVFSGTFQAASNGSMGNDTVVDRQVHSVLRSTGGVQQFVNRTEVLSAQVAAGDEKLQSLSKLVKLTQTLQDEKESELRKQNHELKARLKRQEQHTQRLERELEGMRASLMGHVSKSTVSIEQFEALAVTVDELRAAAKRNESLSSRLDNTDHRCQNVDAALSDFMRAYKDNVHSTTSQYSELASMVKELAETQESTRSVLTSEIQTMKEWATRNLTRLKKHVELINSDLTALQESHVETSTKLEKVRMQAENEQEKLLALLQQKSREATLLTEIVDKEIQSIHSITQQHRVGLGGKLREGASSEGATRQESPPRPRTGRKPLFDDLEFKH